jgi:anti-sigma factor RsiW
MANRRKASACPEFSDRLVDYSDGELAGDERSAIATHITICADCRAMLARLDSSRDQLLNGISFRQPDLRRRTAIALDRWLRWAAIAAVIGLMLVTSLWVMRPRSFVPQLTKVDSLPAPVAIIAAAKLTPPEALWQIAVVEQHARLQASLDLWPNDDSYNEQRQRDRRLMATFQSLTGGPSSGTLP